MMDSDDTRIEQQMTRLLRRTQKIHVVTLADGMDLDRSAYGIMCQLADNGAQRLGAVATAFGLDPSTITRQVRALEDAGLAARTPDPTDGRASILDLTEHGREVLDRTRAHRRERLMRVTADWTPEEREEFGRLLEKFNASVERLYQEG